MHLFSPLNSLVLKSRFPSTFFQLNTAMHTPIVLSVSSVSVSWELTYYVLHFLFKLYSPCFHIKGWPSFSWIYLLLQKKTTAAYQHSSLTPKTPHFSVIPVGSVADNYSTTAHFRTGLPTAGFTQEETHSVAQKQIHAAPLLAEQEPAALFKAREQPKHLTTMSWTTPITLQVDRTTSSLNHLVKYSQLAWNHTQARFRSSNT